MISKNLRYLISIFIVTCGLADAETTEFEITYVSIDHVYIAGGKADGLAVGDKLTPSTQQISKPLLEIVYISEHSSSCKILDSTIEFSAGSMVKITSRSNIENQIENKPKKANKMGENAGRGLPAPTRISGTVALVLYQWFDNSASNLDFAQPSLRVNLTASNVLTENLNFSIKSRGRIDIRSGGTTGKSGETSWENRLWDFSLAYYNPHSFITFGVGRILPRRMGGVGYLDGAMIEMSLTNNITLGLLGGKQPEWLYSDLNQSIKKFGIYTEYKSEIGAPTQVRQAIGFVQEYHINEISRMFIISSGNVRFGRKWGFSHNTEIDINSGWRKERAFYSYSLSNIYLHTYYQVTPKVRTSLNLDRRKSYWTYQYKSLPDSLFDQNINQGLRGAVDYSPFRNVWISSNVGYRKQKSDADPTISYSGNLRLSRILKTAFSFGTFYAGFNGPFERGLNYKYSLDIDLKNFGVISTGFSEYTYTIKGQDDSRSSRELELGMFKSFSRNMYFNGTVHTDSGDDISGIRLQLLLGYRY